MIRPSLFRFFLALTSVTLPLTAAQVTQTIANPNVPGGSIVEVISTDINSLPVTVTVSSIPVVGVTTPTIPVAAAPTAPAAITTIALTTALTTSSTTKAPVVTPVVTQQGPVAQPPLTTVPVGQGVTSYQYTTVDALGQTTVVQDIFTPTYNTPSPPSSPAVGTILGMSAWSALIGTNTSGGPTNGAQRWQVTRSGVGGLLALLCGIVGGALTVL